MAELVKVLVIFLPLGGVLYVVSLWANGRFRTNAKDDNEPYNPQDVGHWDE